jgi:hypothetical protein
MTEEMLRDPGPQRIEPPAEAAPPSTRCTLMQLTSRTCRLGRRRMDRGRMKRCKSRCSGSWRNAYCGSRKKPRRASMDNMHGL